MKTVMILGGGGAFGMNAGHYFASHGWRVVLVGRRPVKPKVFSGPYLTFDHKYIQLSIADTSQLFDHTIGEKIDVIVNFAAQGEGAQSWDNSHWYFETNCVMLSRLVERLSKVRDHPLFVHIGSSEVYGSVTRPATEESPIRPSSPYAASKAAFDFYLMSMAKVRGFHMNIIRPSNCYCPGQALHRIIPRLMWCWARGEKLRLHGGGRARKSYLLADDLSSAIMQVVEADVPGEVFNVGPSYPISIRELVRRAVSELNMEYNDLVIEFSADREGQDGMYWLDSDRMHILGWYPDYTLSSGLRKMVDWARDYRVDLSMIDNPDYVVVE